LAVLVAALMTAAAPAGAVVPVAHRRIAADALTAMPGAKLGKPLRTERQVRWGAPATADWQKLAATGRWLGAFDRATGVPSRIWGSGLAAPGSIASADVAAGVARAQLAAHLGLLAPGAAPSDFELVSNQLDGDVRSVGFVQKHGGRIVVGGQISFRFKRDRLFVIGSEALPNIALPAAPRTQLARAALVDRATVAVRRDLALPGAPVSEPGDEVVLPLVGDDAVLGYRIAVPVTVDGGADGRYLAYTDVATGETLAVRQMNLYAFGTVAYRAVDRYPARPRVDRPVPLAHITLNGAPQTTSTTGQVSWGDDTAQVDATSVIGDLVAIVNKATGGALATSQISLSAAGEAVWDPSATPEDDAQVQTYLNANIAKAFARALDPKMATLDEQITANVNIGQDCNAFFDGKAINFFHASTDCQNTGLIQDVVFHEYGHAVHAAEIIAGVGAFDSSMSEGAADFLAVQITGDHGMGRGFFYSDAPLRDLDPDNSEARWPEDIGEIHKTGLIFGGTFWDLRKALIAQLGDDAGIALTEQLYLGALRRSTNIPTSLIEVLAEDDDDGDLSNGTPHECAIRDAYARHGLRTASGTVGAPARLDQPTHATTIHIALSGVADVCASDKLDHTELDWKPSSDGGPAAGSALAVQTDASTYYAQLPIVADGKILYQVKIVFADSSAITLPDNRADPFYELYAGRTVPLYCTSFETGDPLTQGWTTGTRDGGASPWSWGVPSGGTTDPHAAFSTSHVLSQVLDGDYDPQSSSYVQMPPIDIGPWTDVHLQYRRWLAVEDSHYDQARVTVGGVPAWINYTEDKGDSSAAQHLDREWRFQDIVVSGYQPGHTLDIRWDLTSDEGLQFGGWAIDDVCVVANVNGVCGDGVVTTHETCDLGSANADRPNTCRTWCQLPACGDRIVDDGEACDDGPTGSATCTDACAAIEAPDLGGCCSVDRDPSGSAALAALVLGLVLRRRRR
jgi:MYXO-CTERM domain-containing protein